MNVSKIIDLKRTESLRSIYNRLVDLEVVDYVYGNFTHKYRNNNLSAEELLYIASIIGMDLTNITEKIRENILEGSMKKDNKLNKTMSKFVQELIETGLIPNLNRVSFSYHNRGKDNDYLLLMSQSGEINSVLLKLEEDKLTLENSYEEYSLENEFGEMELDFNVERKRMSQKEFQEEVFNVLYNETETAKALGVYEVKEIPKEINEKYINKRIIEEIKKNF